MHMRTFVLYGAVVAIIAVAVVGISLYSRSSGIPKYTPPAKEPPGKGVVGNATLDHDPYDVLITLTDDGFSPSDISIAQGTRVRFLNKSSASAWPASGVHPTHTLYPEKESTDCLGSAFDACQDIAPGEYYDFTFYYPGTWPYHDHSHAYHTGHITVTASSTPQ
jgi:plastocyanin